jgi:Helix-turn-helix domain
MTDTDLSDWLPSADAAHQIGCSTRTIERLARARKLEQRLRPQAGSPAVAVYNPDDVARIASERRPAPAPFVLPASQTPANGNGHARSAELAKLHFENAGSADDPIRQLFAAALRAVLSPPSPPVSEKVAETPWIDIPTAAACLGRSQSYVRRQIKAGRLHAERDRCLMIRRKDLEQL